MKTFLIKYWKKILLIGLSLILFLPAWLCWFIFYLSGTAYSGKVDGTLDVEYYSELFFHNTYISDISEVEDLAAEVYALTSGRKLENDFRFTCFPPEKRPLRVLWNDYYDNNRTHAMYWGNGDIYLARIPLPPERCLNYIFHEVGHGPSDSVLKNIQTLYNNLKNMNVFPDILRVGEQTLRTVQPAGISSMKSLILLNKLMQKSGMTFPKKLNMIISGNF